jgi:arsenite methyltransferase
VMESGEQVDAYAQAGRIPGGMAAVYLFHTAQISKVIARSESVLDLACGPGTLLSQIAELNPSISFTGVDLSASMINKANEYASERELTNVRFFIDDIARLDTVKNHSVGAVISTMALHHLPNYAALKSSFGQIQRVLKPNGSLYIADFTRLKSLKSVYHISYMNRRHQPYIFSLDTERSMRAAFLLEEFRDLVCEMSMVRPQILSTFLVPLFVIIKTADHSLRKEQHDRFRDLRLRLPGRFRRDLDDMRLFFRLGGLKNDPFG